MLTEFLIPITDNYFFSWRKISCWIHQTSWSLFALSYIALPKINKSLDEFNKQINFHGLSTARNNKSPLALWHESIMHRTQGVFIESTELYGTEYDGSGQYIEDGSNVVEVPESSFDASEVDLIELRARFYPYLDDGNHGVNLFVELKHFSKITDS